MSSRRPQAAGDGKWAIGVDSDQYLTAPKAQQSHILTSALKRIDSALFDYVSAFKDGKAPTGFVTNDLKIDGVGIAYSGGFIDDIKAKITAAADRSRAARSRSRRSCEGEVTPGGAPNR